MSDLILLVGALLQQGARSVLRDVRASQPVLPHPCRLPEGLLVAGRLHRPDGLHLAHRRHFRRTIRRHLRTTENSEDRKEAADPDSDRRHFSLFDPVQRPSFLRVCSGGGADEGQHHASGSRRERDSTERHVQVSSVDNFSENLYLSRIKSTDNAVVRHLVV